MIYILTTGGTIEKQYDPLTGLMDFNGEHIATLIIKARIGVDYIVKPILMKDSLELSDSDRNFIVGHCNSSGERVVITHGTDTIVETANAIALKQENKQQVVVLTGAMVPASMKGSDAFFNLGCALASVQVLPPGIYIAMSGQIFPWDNVRKDVVKGCFYKCC